MVDGWEMIRLPWALGHIFRGGSPLVSARATPVNSPMTPLFCSMKTSKIWGWIFGSMQSWSPGR